MKSRISLPPVNQLLFWTIVVVFSSFKFISIFSVRRDPACFMFFKVEFPFLP